MIEFIWYILLKIIIDSIDDVLVYIFYIKIVYCNVCKN